MTQTYKVPHYMTLGFSLMLVDQEGSIMRIAIPVEEIEEGGISALSDQIVARFIQRGLRPISEAEYNAWAVGQAARVQQERLHEAMQEWTQRHAVDPTRMDAILTAHRGRLGGDA